MTDGMKRGLKLGGALLLGAAQILAADVGTWRNYTSMKDARSVAWQGDACWAATAGGLFRWSPSGDSFFQQTTAEGLSGNDMTAVGLDRDGNVWSGAASGTLYVYTPSTASLRSIIDIQNSSQTSKRINSLASFGDTLLVSIDFGLSIFRVSRFEFGDTFTRFGSSSQSTRISVLSAAIHNGKIWAAITDRQTLNRIAVASLSSPNLLPPEAWTLQVVETPGVVTRGLAVFNGNLYAATSNGLYVSNGTSWSAVPGIGTKSLTGISASATILAVCTEALEAFTLDKSGTTKQYGPAHPFPPLSITLDSQNNPLVGTTGGGILTLSSSWSTHFPNGPNSNGFLGVAVDADGNVWGASGPSNGSGFYRFSGTTWTSYTADNSRLPTNDYYRVSGDCSGAVWLSSFGKGCVEMLRGSTTVDSARIYGRNVGMIGLANDPEFLVLSNALCDNRGNTWLSVTLPLIRNVFAVRQSNGTWRNFPAMLDGNRLLTLTDPAVDRALALDAYDNIWAVVRDPSFRGVISLHNGGRIDSLVRVHLTSANGLPSDDIRTIVADMDNDIWVGTDKGIGIILDPLNPTRKDGIALYKPLAGQLITTIAVDPLNRKWVGTPEGVILLSPDGTQVLGQYTALNTDGKLIDDDVKSIAVDPKTGTVYFGTAQGLASLTTPAAAAKTEFDELMVFPNPFVIPSRVPLTIDGFVAGSRLKILATDGSLVRDLATPGGRIGYWDGKDERGREVSSGVYFLVGYSPEQSSEVAKGKVAIIRK